MTHTIKKRCAISLLFAISVTLTSPVEAATIRETATKKLKEAYEKFEKQWKKIKPCITKGNCSKKQIAVFVGTALVVIGLVSRKRLGQWLYDELGRPLWPVLLPDYSIRESVDILRDPSKTTELSEAAQTEISSARSGIRFDKLGNTDYENLKKLTRQDLVQLSMKVRTISAGRYSESGTISTSDKTITDEMSQTMEKELEAGSNFELVKGFLDWLSFIYNERTIADIKTELNKLAAKQ